MSSDDPSYCGNCPDRPKNTGYQGFVPSVDAAWPAVDFTLQPFDAMQQATIGTTWTQVVSYAIPAGMYGQLLYVGFDLNDPTAYQRVSWRVLRNQGGIGGGFDGIMPALEARCGIVDGTMMPFRTFLRQGSSVSIEAFLSVPAVGETTMVCRGRVQGELRQAQGVE